MKNVLFIFLFLCIVPLTVGSNAHSQIIEIFSNDSTALSTSYWEKNKNKHSYIETERKRAYSDIDLFGEVFTHSESKKYIFFIPVLALLIVVLYLLYKNHDGNIKEEVYFSKEIREEDLLKASEYELSAIEAAQKKDYRLAIRYLYIIALSYLWKNKIIVFKLNKSNSLYCKEVEVSKPELFQSFTELLKYYEYTWFGNRTAQEHHYQHCNKLKEHILEHLNPRIS